MGCRPTCTRSSASTSPSRIPLGEVDALDRVQVGRHPIEYCHAQLVEAAQDASDETRRLERRVRVRVQKDDQIKLGSKFEVATYPWVVDGHTLKARVVHHPYSSRVVHTSDLVKGCRTHARLSHR